MCKPQSFCDPWTASFSKRQQLNAELSCGKCVSDDDSVVETEGGAEDNRRREEKRQSACFTVMF